MVDIDFFPILQWAVSSLHKANFIKGVFDFLMEPLEIDFTQMKKVLIITSSGGGGLLQAANAKEQEIRRKNPSLQIVRKDLLKDWMGARFGNFCLEKWNKAQIDGNVKELRFLITMQVLFDYCSWPYIFLRTLYTLFQEKIDHVIDTQPIGASAIVKALRIYGFFQKKHLFLQKVLVDLPTKAATHFFGPIRRLSKKDHAHFRLVTILPLLEEGETKEEFWKKNCQLTEKEIEYEDLNVRLTFRKYQNQPRPEQNFSFFIRTKNREELSLIQRCLKKGVGLKTDIAEEGSLHFSVPSHAKMITILLGSQPASGATFEYVKKWLQIAKEPHLSKTPCYLFVFCADHEVGKKDLFYQVVNLVETTKKYPENFTVIPISFQQEDVIAPLLHRSDFTCTRSGGQTAMELMCVSTGMIWIHSEAKKKEGLTLSTEELLQGIPGWEAFNALYLEKVRGAKIVTPETFASYVRKEFRDLSSSSILLNG